MDLKEAARLAARRESASTAHRNSSSTSSTRCAALKRLLANKMPKIEKITVTDDNATVLLLCIVHPRDQRFFVDFHDAG